MNKYRLIDNNGWTNFQGTLRECLIRQNTQEEFDPSWPLRLQRYVGSGDWCDSEAKAKGVQI